jgi:ABC-type transport system involved in resistance to organic solvents, periplasmic component
MLKYRGGELIRPGFIGIVLVVLVIAVGLNPERLVSLATDVRYQAEFTDAGGVAVGNDVTVSGMKVGTVTDVELRGRHALVTFAVDGTVSLGSETTAHIRTGTLAGAARAHPGVARLRNDAADGRDPGVAHRGSVLD